ncbi:hypothetical protein DUNSADRAFT_17148 [Dunaliella salina]|uniref:Uncharacterized protein n=1 Tax=Dunaliella salina TaxID=3046 RepID=A0ABQ7H0C9_DUNSA|nr:hypothetical protein DUNSADRAFT_17148 [Dunaliella salina]|eukprot:KAF5840304.1 hypothetical protein DUNSADRAFT_17148 [Dunaliella salina]
MAEAAQVRRNFWMWDQPGCQMAATAACRARLRDCMRGL